MSMNERGAHGAFPFNYRFSKMSLVFIQTLQGLPVYLHSVVEEFSRLLETAIFSLFVFQPSLRLFNLCWVNVDE